MMLLFVRFIDLGFVTVLIAHITFNIPYVILNVLPKLKQANRYTYEAALDLGASPATALRKIVFPQISSGVFSGFCLAVTLSLDDYFIATYTKPATFDTISTYVVNATKGAQTEIKTALWALSAVIFLIVLLIVAAANFRASSSEAERSQV